MTRLFVASLLVGAMSFAPKAALPSRCVTLQASAADIEALSARLGDAAVLETMFLVDGAPRQFLRREQFVSGLVEAAGPALSQDAAYECWLAFGGSPRPATKKKEDKGRGREQFVS